MTVKSTTGGKKRRVIVTGFGLFLVFLLVFVIFFSLNFKTIEVKGDSMEPTFSSGQRLLVSKAYWLVGDIKRNDIVVVHTSEDDYIIKRVYALGGDTVDYLNVPESWTPFSGQTEFIVPEGQLYLLGDNRPVSQDSREFGPVDKNEVTGKVIVVGFGTPPKAQAQTK